MRFLFISLTLLGMDEYSTCFPYKEISPAKKVRPDYDIESHAVVKLYFWGSEAMESVGSAFSYLFLKKLCRFK